MREDRRAHDRSKKNKNAMSMVESASIDEDSDSEPETVIVDGSPSTGSSLLYLI